MPTVTYKGAGLIRTVGPGSGDQWFGKELYWSQRGGSYDIQGKKVVHGKCSKIVTEQPVLQLPISEVKSRSKSIP